MKLSHGEKLILLMLSDLHRKLGVSGEIDPKIVTSAIAGGHLWALDWQYSLVLSAEDKESDVKFVTDVLDMWSILESHFAALPPADQKLVKDAVGDHRTKFIGFDGNNESELLRITQFFIGDFGRFTNFSKHQLNSHMPTAARYKAVLDRFTPLRPVTADRKLSTTELIDILKP